MSGSSSTTRTRWVMTVRKGNSGEYNGRSRPTVIARGVARVQIALPYVYVPATPVRTGGGAGFPGPRFRGRARFPARRRRVDHGHPRPRAVVGFRGRPRG